MDLGLSKQNAVVVGAGRGIGRAIAEAFAAEGANVALLDRDAGVADVAQSVGATNGVRTLGVAADVSNFDAMQTAAAQVENELGPVTHLVFAVGIGSGKMGFPFWNLAPQDWKRV
ncbi:MAG: SDR family NAD(P)-dependent oxidoreductase, partial [Caldilineaceae bacterium]|nr:SDR family NAD(P)-dependent oxidoreductase [Caldilineaceae bacterium]